MDHEAPLLSRRAESEKILSPRLGEVVGGHVEEQSSPRARPVVGVVCRACGGFMGILHPPIGSRGPGSRVGPSAPARTARGPETPLRAGRQSRGTPQGMQQRSPPECGGGLVRSHKAVDEPGLSAYPG